MKASDQAMQSLVDALAAEIGCEAAADFEVQARTLLIQWQKRAERWAREAEAADLLSQQHTEQAADVVAERQGCHRSTVYRRIHRAQSRKKIVARQKHSATVCEDHSIRDQTKGPDECSSLNSLRLKSCADTSA